LICFTSYVELVSMVIINLGILRGVMFFYMQGMYVYKAGGIF